MSVSHLVIRVTRRSLRSSAVLALGAIAALAGPAAACSGGGPFPWR